jgi:RNA recognition motif-containing protein
LAKKLYVGNLSYNTTESGLQTLFAEAGEVTSVAIITDRETGAKRGFAFVEMATDEASKSAIQRFDGYNLDDRQIKVNEARERTTGGRVGNHSRY